ncbi:integrator complex subunit 13-like [Styela clava]
MQEINHKTIFVLDHGPSMKESSKQTIDFDIFMKSRPQGMIPLAPITKSLWTCCMEALCEYCRIVWDIFPREKFLQFVVSDTTSKTLNTWNPKDQNSHALLRALASVGPPVARSDCSVLTGLIDAVKSLSEPTIQQKNAFDDPNVKNVPNRGRIVCITQLKHDVHRRTIEDCVAEAVQKQNELAANPNSGFLPISELDLVIIHIKPFGVDLQISEKPPTPLTQNKSISSELHNVKSTRHGIAIANRLLNLVQKHYDLSVTSVTGIPMKEEQHANSSANYDVLLLHPRLPGMWECSTGSSLPPGDGEPTSTMMLKWFTPKINANELYHCDAAERVSPVDVNSRPSLCLTNFLLSGRSVLLEKWKNGQAVTSSGSGRQTTHMISCHGNDIFLHALNTDKVPFEDPPSISEGVGGKVTDYRINDFSAFMKDGQLQPWGHSKKKWEATTPQPLEKMKSKLERMARHWPLVFSQTVLFSMPNILEPLLSLVMKETLTQDQVVQCKSSIYHIIKMERENTSLPVVIPGSRIKSNKRDEQYKSLWSELENYLMEHSTTSENHREVLDCLLQCLGKADERMETKRAVDTVFESPESPPPMKKVKTEDVTITSRPAQKGAQNLYEMWWKRIENIHQQRHVEFYGRLTSEGNVAKLYPHLNLPDPQEQMNERPGRHQGRGNFHHGGRSSTPSGRSTPTGRSTPSGRLTPSGIGGMKQQKMKREKNKNY